MIIYTRKPNPMKSSTWLYTRTNTARNNLQTRTPTAKVPPLIIRQFEETGASSVEYNDYPDRPRCVFCFGYRSRQRIFNGEMVALCEDHYYSKTIGAIAARMRIIKKEQENGIFIEKPKARRKERQSQPAES